MHRRSRSSRSRRAAAVAASLGVVLAACGGDTEPGTAGQPAATAQATAPAAADPTEAPGGGADTAPAATPATTGTPAPAPTTAAGAATTAAPVQAPEALRFSAPLVGGGTIDAASLAGAPVLFWFWSPF
jgi:hypothetical protein